MSSQALTRIAAVLGILGGLAAIGGGLYAHFMDPQPIFGIPGFMWVDVPIGSPASTSSWVSARSWSWAA